MSLVSASDAPPAPEPDTRTVNEILAKRIAELRDRADAMESMLASMPAEFLDLRASELTKMDIYI